MGFAVMILTTKSTIFQDVLCDTLYSKVQPSITELHGITSQKIVLLFCMKMVKQPFCQ
jgi:hypothetical protein